MLNAYPTPASDTGSESTASRLERLSAAFVHVINERDFEFAGKDAQELKAHIARDWRARLDTYAQNRQVLTFDEQVSQWKKRAEEHPDVHFAIQYISSDVHERKGTAEVFINMEVTGVSNVTLHAMNELKWKRVDGVWKCVQTIGLRGSQMNSGGLG